MRPVIERAREALGEELVERAGALPEQRRATATLYCHASPALGHAELRARGAGTPTTSSCAASTRPRRLRPHAPAVRPHDGPAVSSSSTRGASGCRWTAITAPPTRSCTTTSGSSCGGSSTTGGRRPRRARSGSGELPARRIEQARFDPSLMLRSATVRLSSVLAPRDREFFDLFEEAGGNILRAAGLLEEMLDRLPGAQRARARHPDLRAGGRPDHARHHPAP